VVEKCISITASQYHGYARLLLAKPNCVTLYTGESSKDTMVYHGYRNKYTTKIHKAHTGENKERDGYMLPTYNHVEIYVAYTYTKIA